MGCLRRLWRPLIVQAIGHIEFLLTGTTDSQEATSILSDFFGQEDNHMPGDMKNQMA
jgi:hypothetical protein